MSPLEGYRLLVEEIESARSHYGLAATDAAAEAGSGGPLPCGSCAACCRPPSLLPLEAAVLSEVLGSAALDAVESRPDRCPFLLDAGCLAAGARPVACRLRGLPVRELTADGDWMCRRCGKAAVLRDEQPAQEDCVPIEQWIATLWRLSRAYCMMLAIPVRRVALSEIRPRQRLFAARSR